MSSKLQKNNKMAKPTFSSFFLCVEYEKNKFAMFSVSLYAFYDLIIGGLKITTKNHEN